MKYVGLIVIALISCLGGYWYGYRIGAEESKMLYIAENALHEIDAINELKYNPKVDPVDIHEIQINKAIITYGEYLEKASTPLPGFYSVKPMLGNLVSPVINYRKINPRIVNGVEYSPSNKVFMESEVYKSIPVVRRREFENQNKYYENAMKLE